MISTSKAKVSVIIPVYNAVSYLRQSIESVIGQAEINIEIIVVDDGSNDGSQEIARSYPSVRLIEQSRMGACTARNIGLRNATAEYVKFLDADDYLEPQIIKRQADFLEKSDGRTIVYSDCLFFNNNAGCSEIKVVEIGSARDQVIQLFKTNIQTSAPLHRRKLLLEVDGFDERLAKSQEYNLHIRLAMAGCRFVRLPAIGTHVREHAAPHRITNQRSGQLVQTNADLRRKIYIELLRGHYGAIIPRPLRQYFVSKAAERALVLIRRGDINGVRSAFGRVATFDPTFWDFFVGLAIALGLTARFEVVRLAGTVIQRLQYKGRDF